MRSIERQREIFINGLSGRKPIIPVDPDKLEAAAREKLSKRAFAYIAGGAGRESAIASNQSAFSKYNILPRVLHGLDTVDTSLDLLGIKLQSPFLFAPIGVLELAHKNADRELAAAAGKLHTPVIFSNQVSVSLEQCTPILEPTPFFFQLYWSKSEKLVRSFVERAEQAGAKGIVVTLDTTMLGWRPRDLDLAYLPFLYGRGIGQYTSDPVFNDLAKSYIDKEPPQGRKPGLKALFAIISQAVRIPGRFFSNLTSKRSLAAVRCFVDIYSNPSLNWEHIQKLKSWTSLPVILKGILHPDDAGKAVAIGADAIIVSNHGGRQVDSALAALDALPTVVERVDNQIPVLFDSGIRTGTDAFKALALGANAVCIGRPYAYAIALAGRQGVVSLMKNLVAELELTMVLSGCRVVGDIDHSRIQQVK